MPEYVFHCLPMFMLPNIQKKVTVLLSSSRKDDAKRCQRQCREDVKCPSFFSLPAMPNPANHPCPIHGHAEVYADIRLGGISCPSKEEEHLCHFHHQHNYHHHCHDAICGSTSRVKSYNPTWDEKKNVKQHDTGLQKANYTDSRLWQML